MLAGGLVAAGVGMLAYRQMDDRSTEPMLPDLLAAVRRGLPRHGSGVLIAVEGAPGEQTTEQAARLAERLRAAGHVVVEPDGGDRDRERWAAATREASLSGARAQALAAAAVQADQVERVIRPALSRRCGGGRRPVPGQPAGAVRGRGRPDPGRAGPRRAGQPGRLGHRPAAPGRVGAARPGPRRRRHRRPGCPARSTSGCSGCSPGWPPPSHTATSWSTPTAPRTRWPSGSSPVCDRCCRSRRRPRPPIPARGEGRDRGQACRRPGGGVVTRLGRGGRPAVGGGRAARGRGRTRPR